MALLKIGSTGDEVRKLQDQLRAAGFDPGISDGIYGNKTASAVTAYQKANNLTIDGIAGSQTLGSLYKAPAPIIQPAATTVKADATANLSQLNNVFQPITQVPAQPAPDPYKEKLNAVLDKVLSYDPNAAYDVTTDPLYAPLKEQYEKAGQSAFNNQIGRLSALTGGRPSTAAVGTATAAENEYAKQFSSNVLPSLVSQEQSRRQNAYSSLVNQLNVLQGIVKDNEVKADKTKQEWIGNMGQFYENIQAEINKVQNDGDPSNDWQIPYLKNFRTQKIATMDSTSKANQEKAKASAMDLWEILGTATPEIAKILGVPVGAKTAAYQNMLADNARARSSGGSGGDDGGKPPLTNTQYLNTAKNTLANTIEVKNYKGEIEKVPNMTRHDFEVWLANLIPDDELFDAVYAALNLDAVRFKDEVATSKTGSSTKPKEGYVLINGVWEPSGFNITK